MSFEFELGKPFRPYEQLMGVLPVASMEHIPVAYRVRFSPPFVRSCATNSQPRILCMTQTLRSWISTPWNLSKI